MQELLFYFTNQQGKKVKYPAPLTLNGVQLSWRERAVHLGHTLQQDLTMDADAKEKRAKFISRSVEVRESVLLCCATPGTESSQDTGM